MRARLHACTCAQQWEDGSAYAGMLVLDVDKESSGSKRKFCPHSIFSMSAGVGRGSLKCEDDRSLLSQRLWSDILMCLCLNHTPTHTQPQTFDIPTKPETFRYLTSSYHTLRLRLDLPFDAHFSSALSCCIPCVGCWLWKYLLFESMRWMWHICFAGPRTCSEISGIWRWSVELCTAG